MIIVILEAENTRCKYLRLLIISHSTSLLSLELPFTMELVTLYSPWKLNEIFYAKAWKNFSLIEKNDLQGISPPIKVILQCLPHRII